jgi:hypothetical protein
VARHGRGTAWTRHDMCELALNRTVVNHCKVAFPSRAFGNILKYIAVNMMTFPRDQVLMVAVRSAVI